MEGGNVVDDGPGDESADEPGDVHSPCTSIAGDGASEGSCTEATRPETGVSVDK